MPEHKPPQPDMNEHGENDSLPGIDKENDIKPPTHLVDGKYIKEWLVLGPFFPNNLEMDFLVDVGGEENVDPKEGDTVTTADGTTLTWKRYTTKGNIIDLLDAVGNHEKATAYAFCVLRSEIEGDAEISFGNGDDAAVWINGNQVHSNSDGGNVTLDQHQFEVVLKAGRNRCLVKVPYETEHWGLAARVTMLPVDRAVLSGIVTDEVGQPIPNATVRLEQNGEELAQTTTDEEGNYHFNIHPVRGHYALSVTSGEKGDWSFGIQPCEGEAKTLNLTLKEAISIEGTLLKLDDITPHLTVPVQAIRNGKVISTTLSDKNGNYRFINLKPGQYQIRCQRKGGYVYYGEGKKPVVDKSHAKYLQVESGKTLKNIDFRFAPFKKGTWKNYNYLDGLGANDVRAVYRASDGTLWFALWSGGVSKYDGNEFITFTSQDGLAHNLVYAIHQTPDGTLWLGTFYGISRYDGEKFATLTTKDGLAANPVYTIHQARDGALWFGTWGGVSCYDGEKFVNFAIKDGLAHNWVTAIHQDQDGVLWFGTSGGGVSRYDGREFVALTTKDGLASNRVRTILQDQNGVLWFGTWSSSVSKFDGKEFVTLTTRDGLASNDVCTIYQDRDGVLWFGTLGGGVSRYDGKTFVNFTPEDGLASNGVRTIHQAPDGLLWFGTVDGISRYDENRFINFSTKDGLVGNNIWDIHQTPDGSLWAGAFGRGVSHYDGKRFVNFTTKDGLVDNKVCAIHQARDGILWFGTYGGGVSRYDGEEFVNFTTKDGLVGNNIWDIHQEPDGSLWFGTYFGISRYDGERFVNFTTEDGLAHNSVYTIHQNPDGVLWFGTRLGVTRYDGKEFINFTNDELSSVLIWAIHRAPNGVMWIGTMGFGVFVYDGKEFVNLTTKDGLAENIVRTIYQTPDGVLWFGTHHGGVSFYDGTSWGTLDTRDGLADDCVFKILQDSEGYLWFTTKKGITRYHRNNIPPSVHITSVRTDVEYTEFETIPPITAGDRVTISYNAIDFNTLPQKRQYRYRIKEIDSSWRKPTKATSFDYTFDESGSYTFEVQAIDSELNYSDSATVSLTVQADRLLVALQTEVNHLRREVGRKYHFDNIIGRSAPIKQMYALMEKAIDSGLTVLISGETGTGKELVAKAIHYNSLRKDKPFIPLNCGAIPKDMVASELFGHRKGAFTGARENREGLFEVASGGTVLLDEIGEMPEDAQVHLLRVLQERKVQRIGETQLRDVDVRVIAVTNRDLAADAEAARFREDLYYRLKMFPIHVPPLRERVDDIPLLMEHFLQKACGQQNKELNGFAPDVMEMLQSYPWPGNVRELENEIYRAVALVEEGLHIQPHHFSSQLTRGESLVQEVLSKQAGYRELLDRFGRRVIEEALRENSGNRSATARQLRMDRSNLVAVIKRLGIKA